MRIDHHVWHSSRLGWDMGVAVFGHWGQPMLAFPTSHGDQWELQRHGLIDAIGDFIDAGRIKVYCVGSNNQDSFMNRGAHPFHRSWRQRMFDEYIRQEVVPFIDASTQSPGIPITTFGASLGAYHAANTLLRYPDRVKRGYAFSGIYDLRRFMDGLYDENFYFHNPIDYVANLDDGWNRHHLESCELRLVTGSGPFEDSSHTYAFSRVLKSKGIRHYVDDWGWKGGHDWPYWKEMLREYVGHW